VSTSIENTEADAKIVARPFTVEFGTDQRRGLTLTLLGAVFAVHVLDRQILAILIPPIKAELGLSDSRDELDASRLLSALAFGVAGAMGTYLFGRVTDAVAKADIGRRSRMRAGCQLTVAALWLAALLIDDPGVTLVAWPAHVR
jgi:hypothetical protein